MNILVIGGTRFIGAHAVAMLAEAGHTVTVFHRGKHNADLVPDSVEHIHGNRLDLDMKRTVDWERENPPEEYDQSIFDYDTEDRALASALKKDN